MMWELFEHYGIVYKVNKGNFIVPSKFPPIPSDINMNTAPQWDGDSSYVGRSYLFTRMNNFCFCKLVSALHLFVTEVAVQTKKSLHLTHVYQNMLELEVHSRGTKKTKLLGVCRISYDYEYNRVTLFVCEDDPSNSFFCLMAEELELIFSSEDVFIRPESSVELVCLLSDTSIYHY